MKLETKFFRSFFYPFLVAVTLNMLIVTLFLYVFTNNYYDKKTAENIVYLEKKTSKVYINSVNSLITTTLLKVQASLNEQILYYLKLANKTDKIINNTLNSFVKCMLNIDMTNPTQNTEKFKYTASWYVNESVTEETLDNYEEIKLQLITYSNILPNVYATYVSTRSTVLGYYFAFEKTDMTISFPLDYFYNNGYVYIFLLTQYNPSWCLDSKGNPFMKYKYVCREIYQDVKRAKMGSYDLNNKDSSERTIYVTNTYSIPNPLKGTQFNVFNIYIEFFDPISNGIAYAFADVLQEDLTFTSDNFNSKLSGYFLISSVGFNKVFYYPNMGTNSKTISENIFRWDIKFYLQEKTNFIKYIEKILTSNYNRYINDKNQNIYDEIKVKGDNDSLQYFYFDGDKYFYKVYPIVLESLKGVKEHVLSIIYLYNNNLFYSRLESYQSKTFLKIFLEIVIFVVFGSGLLYLVVLSFNTLAKYIVIPIKNVNYMLKGIHIGGENRLEYLDFLKKRQDENLEKLDKIYNNNAEKKMKNELLDEPENQNQLLNNNEEQNNNKNINNNIDQEDINLIKNNEVIEQENQNINDMKYNGEIIDPKEDYNKKFDEESEYIEKEINFYDFDEELLQYRPLEIDRLVKVLLDLKGALLLTSADHQVEQIINYSYSEEIFRNFKNKEGTSICQSNIGNLQSQLLKFDKAIYHLALSLQDDKLKRFLSRTLSDELDESDTLLHKISLSFNKDKDKERINILAEKQQNNSRDNFSQKVIGILINSRYCKLISVYFKFFSFMQKSNIELLNGQFMNTNFHTINYYHKIIIQYIYLSYVKNDLIKIGESILDYIEFLIKFKFKISSDSKYILNIHNRDRPEFKEKQQYKKKIFDKILGWLDLFDNYTQHVRDNSSLGDDKSLFDDYSNCSNNEFNSYSQSVFLFRVNIQRGDFLKGKFALSCKNYNDALFFFIRAAKKKSIVLDGLIQKKALKHIFKITGKIMKNLQEYGIFNSSLNQKLNEYDKIKNKEIKKKNTHITFERNNTINEVKSQEEKNGITFREELDNIKNEILKDINECNIKQAKDIIILIDCNLYKSSANNNNNIHSNRVESFIDQTKTILKNYLSNNDRLGVFIYTQKFQIICPLMSKMKIDINNFKKDLIFYKTKKKYSRGLDEFEEYYIEPNENDIFEEKIEFQSNKEKFSEKRIEDDDSSDDNEKYVKNLDIIIGLIKSINYTKDYLKRKESIKNEKYIILFTDLFNNYRITDEEIEKIFEKLCSDSEIHFLLLGKNKLANIKTERDKLSEEEEEKRLNEIIIEKFGEKSELIDFEDMKKIQTILSNNNVIKDEIIYPNEIYK